VSIEGNQSPNHHTEENHELVKGFLRHRFSPPTRREGAMRADRATNVFHKDAKLNSWFPFIQE
jgi:hypothetical protein